MDLQFKKNIWTVLIIPIDRMSCDIILVDDLLSIAMISKLILTFQENRNVVKIISLMLSVTWRQKLCTVVANLVFKKKLHENF